ncbi:MAG: hypothetical protein WBB34_18255 [Xanthobacteraceae bacterium]
MAYTGTVDAAGGFPPATARPASTSRRRNLWHRAFARLLVARRQAAEREVAEFVRLSGLKLPDSARRLRRSVGSRAAPRSQPGSRS